MKIFMFASRYPVPYKPYYDTQFADLVSKGHDLTVFSGGALDRDTINEKVLRYDLDERTRRYPAFLSNVPASSVSILAGGMLRPVSSLRAARRAWRATDAESRVRKLRILARVLAVNAGDPDLCYVHGLGTGVHFRWLRHAFPGSATAMFYHGGEVPAVEDVSDRAAQETFASFDVVFTNTRASRRQALDRGCPEDRLRVLPVGFAVDEYAPPSGDRGGREDGTLRLLSAGRLSEEKGIVYALRALKLLDDRGVRDVDYAIAGDGPAREKLERFVPDNGLGDRVRFLGLLTTEALKDAMDRADVLVLPSFALGNWAETQACAVQEAMLKECLAVTTRCGGVPESIPDCMQPYCVPERDASALADAVEEIRGMPAARRRELGRRCRAFVLENYDIEELNERMLATIREAADGRPSRRARGVGAEG